MGGNDLIQGLTAEEFYQNYYTLRRKMIEQGWWVPGVTQIALMDFPRSDYITGLGYPDNWAGLQYMLTKTIDRVGMVSSVGVAIEPTFPVHFLPTGYTSLGEQTGDMVLDQIPLRSGVLIGALTTKGILNASIGVSD
jgi:hypothetical protein